MRLIWQLEKEAKARCLNQTFHGENHIWYNGWSRNRSLPWKYLHGLSSGTLLKLSPVLALPSYSSSKKPLLCLKPEPVSVEEGPKAGRQDWWGHDGRGEGLRITVFFSLAEPGFASLLHFTLPHLFVLWGTKMGQEKEKNRKYTIEGRLADKARTLRKEKEQVSR
jgi:hypothetical protein